MFKSKPAAGAAEAAEVIIGALSSMYHLDLAIERSQVALSLQHNDNRGPYCKAALIQIHEDACQP